MEDRRGIPDDRLMFLILLVLGIQAGELGGHEDPDFKRHLAQANSLREQGAFTEAEAICRLLIEKTRGLGERNPSYAVALNCLGAVFYDQDRDAEAIPVLEKALSILESSSAEDDVQLSACRFLLGACYRQLGRYREAEAMLAAGLPATEKRFGPSHPETASALLEWGLLLRDTGRWVESETALLRSLRIRQETLGKENTLTGVTLAALGTTYTCLGRYSEAESSLRRSASIAEKRSDPILAATLLDLGAVYYVLGSLDQADSVWRRAATIVQGVPQATGLRQEILVRHGALALFQRRLNEAERLLNEAATLAGRSDVRLATILTLQGDLYAIRREDQRADDAYRRGMLLVQATKGPEHHSVATCLVRLALFRRTQGRLDEASSLFEKALEIDRKTIGPQHPTHGIHLADYAVLLRKMKRKDEAKEVETQARAIAEANRGNAFLGSTIDVRELQKR